MLQKKLVFELKKNKLLSNFNTFVKNEMLGFSIYKYYF
jgi:hypothetical protein